MRARLEYDQMKRMVQKTPKGRQARQVACVTDCLRPYLGQRQTSRGVVHGGIAISSTKVRS